VPKGPLKGALVNIHKQLGIAVFILVWWRLVWRWKHQIPPITPALTRAMDGISHLAHGLLYLAMIVIPALGVLFKQARGDSVDFLGWTLPAIVDDGTAMQYAKTLKSIHETLGNALIWLIAAHVAAVLYHYWVRRDDTLQRMVGRAGNKI
jgi:cytochrome b561